MRSPALEQHSILSFSFLAVQLAPSLARSLTLCIPPLPLTQPAMASLSGSSARKLVAAAIWGAFVFVVALQGPSSTTARPLPNGVDEATPEWPCCRQYDGPPGAVPAEETDDIVVPATAHEPIAVIPAGAVPTPAAANLTAEAADTDTANPEWPCCRQYDTPPGIGSTPADSGSETVSQVTQTQEVPSSVEDADHGHPGVNGGNEAEAANPEVNESQQAGGDVDESSTDAAQPEWPCCRQYDAPPADAEGVGN